MQFQSKPNSIFGQTDSIKLIYEKEIRASNSHKTPEEKRIWLVTCLARYKNLTLKTKPI